MAFTSLALMGAGVATSTVGSYFAASGQKSALKGQAEISDLNARVTDLAADSAILSGQKQEQSVLMKGAHLKSAQKVSLAANGIDMTSMTAQNILNSTDVMKEIDANTVKANAVRAAWGYKTQATNYRADAIMKRGAADGINPTMIAASTFLEGAGKVASSWYMMDKVGAFGDADVAAANKTDDPIFSLGSKRNWWSK